ncbi:probable G-protein coupled receptor 171 [Esox lucius]|uniref:G-protein coupled receptors family 1 profile domain-containing protein n=1 Tax=Esox lucius TaxID=8010 RepID=A0A3P8ZKW9_ESOLU|nr:probable G-protein coupled receptor 171 [Esox lucius]
MMALPTNTTNDVLQCIINDQMAPFSVLYILVFFISMASNLVALWAFTRSYDAKKSIHVYLVNLLASDLLLTLALPFKVAKDLGLAPWGLMVFHCQMSAVVIYIGMYAAILFLTFISIDCCLQISQSTRCLHIQEVGFARLMSVMVWLLVLLVMVPNMALPILDIPKRKFLSCSHLKRQMGLQWHALAVFLCTFLFLNASVAVLLSNGLVLKRLLVSQNDPEKRRSTHRANAKIATVTAAFVVCFVPYHVVRTPYTLAQTEVITPDCQTSRRLFLAKESTLLLVVLHICLDPVLYYYLCKAFRQRVRIVFESIRSRRDLNTNPVLGPAAENLKMQPLTCQDNIEEREQD